MAWRMLCAQRVHVVTVDHADVGEPELLEQHAGHQERLHRLLDVLAQAVRLAADGGDPRDAVLQVLAQPGERRVQTDAVEVELEGADVGADGHLVVVEHHDQRRAQVTGLVERLEGDPAREGAVAEHADDVAAVLAGDALRLDQAQPVADGGRGVPGADHVVRRLRAVGKAGEAAVLPDRPEPVAAARQQLVRVALVAHVPDDLVLGAPQHAVQGDGQIDRAQARGEVPAGLAHAGEDGLADLVGEQRQLSL